MIKVGSDFSGVGAFDQALKRLNIEYKTVFSCDMDKYARQTYIHNYGEPDYYPENVYDREIPKESLDIYMTSPPCQAFSLAGKRKGEDDKRGILFYNSHEFIKDNRPRYFIFENVKGLLSDDNGNTFAKWVQYLGGKSVNGLPTLFKHEEAVDYHIYWKVLNAKNYGIPQNRERVFIIGIRDDEDNTFSFPKEEFLTKRLKDVLESDVDEKYFLSDKIIRGFISHTEKQKEKGNGFKWLPKDKNDVGNCITARVFKMGVDDNYIKVKSDTKKGYELTEISNDSVAIGAIRGRNTDNPTSLISGQPTQQMLEINHNGTSNALTTVQKDNVVVETRIHGWHENENVVAAHRSDSKRSTVSEHVYHKKSGICTTIQTAHVPKLYDYRIRKLTPRECFRLMDFPDTFTWPVSDSQAYKQAGNSICVGVLAKIIEKLKIN